MSSVGDIAVRVGADTADLERNFASAAKRVKMFADKSKESLKKYGKSVKGGAAVVGKLAVAITAATAAVTAMQRASAQGARDIKNFSRVANETTENFQALAFGARAYGIESDKLSDILKDVNDKVGDFAQTGGGALKDFFEQIAPKVGVTAEQFKNLSGSQALQLYITSLERANLSQADMTFFMEAIASDATNLIPLFANNGKEIKKMGAEAERLNAIISDSDLNKLADSNVEFSKMTDAIRAARDAVSILFLPELEKISSKIVEITRKFTDFIKKLTLGRRETEKELELREKINQVLGVANEKQKRGGAHNRRAARNAKKIVEEKTQEVIKAERINALLIEQNRLQEQLAITTKTETVGQSRKRTFKVQMSEEEKAAHDDLVNAQIAANEILINQLSQQSEKAKQILDIRRAAVAVTQQQTEQAPAIEAETLEEKTKRMQAQADVEIEAMRILSKNKALLKEQEYLTEEEKLAQHLDKLKNIHDSGQSAILNLIAAKSSMANAVTAGSFVDMLNTVSQGSKRAFEISKKFAIADALVSTYQGIAAGVKLGWPLAIPAVAYASAQGFGAIKQIKSQSFSGGGGGGGQVSAVSSSGGGGSTGGSQSQPAQAQQNQTLQVAPIDPSAIFSGSAMQAIAEQVYNFSKDGGDVVFS